ncbi:MAG: RNA methyltransferase [Nitrospirota bacterium]
MRPPEDVTTWKTRVRIVLVRPEHAGNIGAAARALKNFGLSRLDLVAPECGHLTSDSLKMAYGARNVIEGARIHATLREALADARWAAAFGMARPDRPDARWLADAAPALAEQAHAHDTALVFGPERSGLSNDELALCHQLVAVPTDPAQPSLNLAQAVLLGCYELTRAASPPPASPRALATGEEIDGLTDHLDTTLHAIGFLQPPQGRRLLHELRGFISRAQPSPREVRVLRGILRQIGWAMKGGRGMDHS